MGNICSCFEDKNTASDFPSPKTPLLSGGGVHVTQQPKGSEVNVTQGQSARAHRPQNEEKFLTSLEVLSAVSLAPVTTLSSLDKTFQDHAKLYNDLYGSFMGLRQGLHDFKAAFEKDTAGIPVMADCLKLLSQRCGGSTFKGTRQKNCIQISFDRREVSQTCRGPAEEILASLELYNKINQSIKSVLEKAPKVKSSILVILEEETRLKRELTKADPDGKAGPQPVKNAADNFVKLHKLPEYIDTIHKYTSRTFKEISAGSKILFEDSA